MVSSVTGGHQSKLLWSSSLCHSTSSTHHYTPALTLSLLANHQTLLPISLFLSSYSELHNCFNCFAFSVSSLLLTGFLLTGLLLTGLLLTGLLLTEQSSTRVLHHLCFFTLNSLLDTSCVSPPLSTSNRKLLLLNWCTSSTSTSLHFMEHSLHIYPSPHLLFQLVKWPPCLPVTLQLDTLSILVTPGTHLLWVPNFNCLNCSVSFVQCPRLTHQGMNDSFPLNMPP